MKSMTGFGRAEFQTPHGPVRIELKSTNLKFFELSSRLPEDLVPFADPVRKMIQKRVKRGKVFLTVSAPEVLVTPGKLRLDERLARQYYNAFVRLGKVLKTGEKPSVALIARMPDVLTRAVTTGDVRAIWRKAKGAIEKAVAEFDRSRVQEGRALGRDMGARAAKIAKALRKIDQRAPKVISLHKKKLEKRHGESAEPDLQRLQAELAAFAKGTDVTEEIVRLRSHVRSFAETLKSGGEMGRKIDFIAQEMIRETNTIGSKCNDYTISDVVIHVKAELEKIREQAQNVE